MTPESKAMHGIRESDDDGFTYVSGKHKVGRVKRPRNRVHAEQAVRYDKRAVKAKEIRRMMREQAE